MTSHDQQQSSCETIECSNNFATIITIMRTFLTNIRQRTHFSYKNIHADYRNMITMHVGACKCRIRQNLVHRLNYFLWKYQNALIFSHWTGSKMNGSRSIIERYISFEQFRDPIDRRSWPIPFIVFLKRAIPGLFSIQLTVNNVQYKFHRWLDSNHRPLVSEATALPTEPPTLPFIRSFVSRIIVLVPTWFWTWVFLKQKLVQSIENESH